MNKPEELLAEACQKEDLESVANIIRQYPLVNMWKARNIIDLKNNKSLSISFAVMEVNIRNENLLNACYNDDYSTIKRILDIHPLTSVDKPMEYACQNKDIKLISALLPMNKQLTPYDFKICLIHGVKSDEPEIVDKIIKNVVPNGVNPNKTIFSITVYFWTLECCIENDCIKIFEHLYSQYHSDYLGNIFEHTPLSYELLKYCCQVKNGRILEFLTRQPYYNNFDLVNKIIEDNWPER